MQTIGCFMKKPICFRVLNPSSMHLCVFCVKDKFSLLLLQMHLILLIFLPQTAWWWHLQMVSQWSNQSQLLQGIPSGVKHCWTQPSENRNWHNICTCSHVNFASYLYIRSLFCYLLCLVPCIFWCSLVIFISVVCCVLLLLWCLWPHMWSGWWEGCR